MTASPDLPSDVERFDWLGHRFDQIDGLGNVPDVAEVSARGFVAFMRPTAFLALCPAATLEQPGVERAIAAGRPISMGFLRVDLSGDAPAVVGHEGRHRMEALRRLAGDVPFPVAVLLAGGLRARHLDGRVMGRLRDGMLSQGDDDGRGVRLVRGPTFDRAVLSGRPMELGGGRALSLAAAATSLSTNDDGRDAMDTLPDGWSEAFAGGMATNPDPDLGGIVDRTIMSSMGKAMPGGWFVVFHRDGLPVIEDLPSREEAFEAFAEALGLDADEFLGRQPAPRM